MDAPNAPPQRADKPRRKKSLAFRIVRGGFIVAALALVLLFALEMLLRSGVLRGQMEVALSEGVGARVRVGELRMSLFSGFEVRDLAVANPDGFPQDRDLLSLASARGGVSLAKLARGRLALDARVTGLTLRVHQRRDGKSNVESLARVRSGGAPPDAGGGGGGTGERAGDALARLRLDLRLEDAALEITHEDRGVVESWSDVRAALRKDFGTGAVHAELAAKTRDGGEIELRAALAAARDVASEVHLRTTRLDLARYRPLVAAAFGPDALTRLEGVVSADLDARVLLASDTIDARGEIVVERPRLAGAWLRGLEVSAERFVLAPNVRAGIGTRRLDLSRVRADLGFARVEGLPAAEGEIGLAWRADLRAIAGFAGSSAEVRAAAGEIEGRLVLALPSRLDERTLASELRLRLDAHGALDLALVMDRGWTNAFTVRMTTRELHLGAYERAIAALLEPGALTACEGTLAAHLDARVDPGARTCSLEGDLRLANGRFAGTLIGSSPVEDAHGGVRGSAVVPLASPMDLRALRVDARAEALGGTWAEQTLAAYDGPIRVADGKLALASDAGALLNGGPFALALDVDLDRAKQMPADLRIEWNGGRVTTRAGDALRWFLPVLAGAELTGRLDTQMRFQGPMLAKDGENLLQWLDAWQGGGRLHLLQGAFTPAPALRELLPVLGVEREITFDRLGGEFRLAQGYVTTELARLDGKARKLGLSGRTSLSGELDWRIDVTALLEGHKDGERVRKALGGRALEAPLGGTITHPRLSMPDLGKLLVQGALDGLKSGELPKLVEELFKKKKKG